MDLYWRDLLTAPTEQEYLDMVSNSTYSLYIFSCSSVTCSSRVSRNWGFIPSSCEIDASRVQNRLVSIFHIFFISGSPYCS